MAARPRPMPWKPGSTPTGPTCQWGSGRSCAAMTDPLYKNRSASVASEEGVSRVLTSVGSVESMQRPGRIAPATPSTQPPRRTPATRASASIPPKVLWSISRRTNGSLGDSERSGAIPQRASSHPRRLGDLLGTSEPPNLVILHRPVLPDRTLFALLAYYCLRMVRATYPTVWGDGKNRNLRLSNGDWGIGRGSAVFE